MLDTLKQPIVKLIAAYEAEKSERERLAKELQESKDQNETYRKQILELERQIDNLKLSEAFKGTAGNGTEAKKKVDALLREIDRCIKLIGG
jgi:predicted  nucleic acid-binding Zn-ribbon protein